MRVSVVGLGPGPVDWVPPAALGRLRLAGARVFVRTRFFPNIEQVVTAVSKSTPAAPSLPESPSLPR